ncbi:MAG: DUF374 domain-containing protein [Gammaproteobacteria bacterium]
MRLKHFLKISDENDNPTLLFKILRFLVYRLASTWRFTYVGPKIAEPAVVALWHDQIYPLSKGMQNTNSVALVSPSRDGKIVAQFVAGLGHDFIYGSSKKSSTSALRQLILTAKTRKVFVTSDGPLGPRHKMKAGALIAAQKAQVPLYLMKFICCGYRFNSWDRFLIPYPFTKIKAVVSSPRTVPEYYGKAEMDKLAEKCETWLNDGLME